ncbi:DAK2 domain-containing protein [Dolosicoccus paucivorans]|uniref:DAK2 domain-containing protein n=1 Tax=Dolosicoccus paucivorans TaxID=84521 RepID=UPI0015E0AD22|nr:DAK2 domain-containing protein [Dolosicoccus paucivorans]
MILTKLTNLEFQGMIASGAKNLTENVDLINSLNVFPVPDGDTGTNMNMTFVSGSQNVAKATDQHVGQLSQALAKGLLMGARGNSGVILSQIFRGFSSAIKDHETLDAQQFAHAFSGGVESAYKAVMKPVEGTILTVARESAIAGEKKAQETDNIIEIMEAIVEGAKVSLDNTPNLLPVLKQVGVVDSGGKGLLCIYEGFLASLKGEDIVKEDLSHLDSPEHVHAIFDDANEHPLSMDDITYGFCTEIMVRIGEGPTVRKSFDYEGFRQRLNKMGDSLLVIADDEIVKVHVHTEDPGKVMQLGQEFGELIHIKVDNMREQVRELEQKEQTQQAPATPQVPVEQKDMAVIAVAAGKGMVELFKSLGVDEVLEGGQTMNPSTEDFVKLVEKVNAKQVVLLPNNKNITMAAEQVNDLVDADVAVVATRSIPQGIVAMMTYDESASLSENQEAMNEGKNDVVTGQITYAIRDTQIDGIDIKEKDYMGIIDDKIKVSTPSIEESLKQTLELMIDEDTEILTILIGEDGEDSILEPIIDELEEQYEDMEVEVVQTDQPVYHYIIAAE